MGRRILLLLVVGVAMLVVAYGVRPTPEARSQVADGCTGVFDFSGESIDFTVPNGITVVELDVLGAAGGDATGAGQGNNIGQGGLGAAVQHASLAVASGQRLTVIVGGEGGAAQGGSGGSQRIAGGIGGFGYDGTTDGGQSGGQGGDATGYHGGGGGGGASAVLRNGVPVISAGGGGGGAHGGFGGDGGTVGTNGTSTGTGRGDAFGVGATATAGGAGGTGQHGGGSGVTGVQGAGGAGGAAVNTSGGQSSPGGDAGGGGGGGQFGGGGAGGSGASNSGGGAGGGGGSSVTTIGTIEDGVRDGDGLIQITLSDDECPGELEIQKSVSDATPDIGDRITYTVEVTNNGPNDDTDVVVTDSLPPEVEYVSDNCSNSRNVPPWTWEVGDLDNGDTVTCDITVKVVDSGQDIPNTASVGGRNFDRRPGNNEDTVTITVPPPEYDLEIVKDVSPTQVLVGDEVTYTLSVTNLGPETSEAGGVIDLLPPEVQYVSDTCGGSVHNADPPPLALSNGQVVDLPAGTYWVAGRSLGLPPDETVVCQITVTVVAPGDAILNRAGVISHGPEAGLELKNNLDDATISAVPSVSPGTPSNDLAIDKAGPAKVQQGARFSWTMTVTNNGPQASTGSTVVDRIPEAAIRPRTSTPGCSIASHRLDCQIGALAVGESTRIVVSARAPRRAGCRTNPAGVSGNVVDPDATNNNDLARTCTVVPKLRLRKSTGKNVVRPGEVISYRIVVSNVGNGTARHVRVCDMPSPDLEIIRAPGAKTVSPHRACWVITSLAPGKKRNLRVIAQVTDGAERGVKPNTARARAANARALRRSTARVRVRPLTGACSAAVAIAARC